MSNNPTPRRRQGGSDDAPARRPTPDRAEGKKKKKQKAKKSTARKKETSKDKDGKNGPRGFSMQQAATKERSDAKRNSHFTAEYAAIRHQLERLNLQDDISYPEVGKLLSKMQGVRERHVKRTRGLVRAVQTVHTAVNTVVPLTHLMPPELFDASMPGVAAVLRKKLNTITCGDIAKAITAASSSHTSVQCMTIKVPSMGRAMNVEGIIGDTVTPEEASRIPDAEVVTVEDVKNALALLMAFNLPKAADALLRFQSSRRITLSLGKPDPAENAPHLPANHRTPEEFMETLLYPNVHQALQTSMRDLTKHTISARALAAGTDTVVGPDGKEIDSGDEGAFELEVERVAARESKDESASKPLVVVSGEMIQQVVHVLGRMVDGRSDGRQSAAVQTKAQAHAALKQTVDMLVPNSTMTQALQDMKWGWTRYLRDVDAVLSARLTVLRPDFANTKASANGLLTEQTCCRIAADPVAMAWILNHPGFVNKAKDLGPGHGINQMTLLNAVSHARFRWARRHMARAMGFMNNEETLLTSKRLAQMMRRDNLPSEARNEAHRQFEEMLQKKLEARMVSEALEQERRRRVAAAASVRQTVMGYRMGVSGLYDKSNADLYRRMQKEDAEAAVVADQTIRRDLLRSLGVGSETELETLGRLDALHNRDSTATKLRSSTNKKLFRARVRRYLQNLDMAHRTTRAPNRDTYLGFIWHIIRQQSLSLVPAWVFVYAMMEFGWGSEILRAVKQAGQRLQQRMSGANDRSFAVRPHVRGRRNLDDVVNDITTHPKARFVCGRPEHLVRMAAALSRLGVSHLPLRSSATRKTLKDERDAFLAARKMERGAGAAVKSAEAEAEMEAKRVEIRHKFNELHRIKRPSPGLVGYSDGVDPIIRDGGDDPKWTPSGVVDADAEGEEGETKDSQDGNSAGGTGGEGDDDDEPMPVVSDIDDDDDDDDEEMSPDSSGEGENKGDDGGDGTPAGTEASKGEGQEESKGSDKQKEKQKRALPAMPLRHMSPVIYNQVQQLRAAASAVMSAFSSDAVTSMLNVLNVFVNTNGRVINGGESIDAPIPTISDTGSGTDMQARSEALDKARHTIYADLHLNSKMTATSINRIPRMGAACKELSGVAFSMGFLEQLLPVSTDMSLTKLEERGEGKNMLRACFVSNSRSVRPAGSMQHSSVIALLTLVHHMFWRTPEASGSFDASWMEKLKTARPPTMECLMPRQTFAFCMQRFKTDAARQSLFMCNMTPTEAWPGIVENQMRAFQLALKKTYTRFVNVPAIDNDLVRAANQQINAIRALAARNAELDPSKRNRRQRPRASVDPGELLTKSKVQMSRTARLEAARDYMRQERGRSVANRQRTNINRRVKAEIARLEKKISTFADTAERGAENRRRNRLRVAYDRVMSKRDRKRREAQRSGLKDDDKSLGFEPLEEPKPLLPPEPTPEEEADHMAAQRRLAVLRQQLSMGEVEKTVKKAVEEAQESISTTMSGVQMLRAARMLQKEGTHIVRTARADQDAMNYMKAMHVSMLPMQLLLMAIAHPNSPLLDATVTSAHPSTRLRCLLKFIVKKTDFPGTAEERFAMVKVSCLEQAKSHLVGVRRAESRTSKSNQFSGVSKFNNKRDRVRSRNKTKVKAGTKDDGTQLDMGRIVEIEDGKGDKEGTERFGTDPFHDLPLSDQDRIRAKAEWLVASRSTLLDKYPLWGTFIRRVALTVSPKTGFGGDELDVASLMDHITKPTDKSVRPERHAFFRTCVHVNHPVVLGVLEWLIYPSWKDPEGLLKHRSQLSRLLMTRLRVTLKKVDLDTLAPLPPVSVMRKRKEATDFAIVVDPHPPTHKDMNMDMDTDDDDDVPVLSHTGKSGRPSRSLVTNDAAPIDPIRSDEANAAIAESLAGIGQIKQSYKHNPFVVERQVPLRTIHEKLIVRHPGGHRHIGDALIEARRVKVKSPIDGLVWTGSLYSLEQLIHDRVASPTLFQLKTGGSVPRIGRKELPPMLPDGSMSEPSGRRMYVPLRWAMLFMRNAGVFDLYRNYKMTDKSLRRLAQASNQQLLESIRLARQRRQQAFGHNRPSFAKPARRPTALAGDSDSDSDDSSESNRGDEDEKEEGEEEEDEVQTESGDAFVSKKKKYKRLSAVEAAIKNVGLEDVPVAGFMASGLFRVIDTVHPYTQYATNPANPNGHNACVLVRMRKGQHMSRDDLEELGSAPFYFSCPEFATAKGHYQRAHAHAQNIESEPTDFYDYRQQRANRIARQAAIAQGMDVAHDATLGRYVEPDSKKEEEEAEAAAAATPGTEAKKADEEDVAPVHPLSRMASIAKTLRQAEAQTDHLKTGDDEDEDMDMSDEERHVPSRRKKRDIQDGGAGAGSGSGAGASASTQPSKRGSAPAKAKGRDAKRKAENDNEGKHTPSSVDSRMCLPTMDNLRKWPLNRYYRQSTLPLITDLVRGEIILPEETTRSTRLSRNNVANTASFIPLSPDFIMRLVCKNLTDTPSGRAILKGAEPQNLHIIVQQALLEVHVEHMKKYPESPLRLAGYWQSFPLPSDRQVFKTRLEKESAKYDVRQKNAIEKEAEKKRKQHMKNKKGKKRQHQDQGGEKNGNRGTSKDGKGERKTTEMYERIKEFTRKLALRVARGRTHSLASGNARVISWTSPTLKGSFQPQAPRSCYYYLCGNDGRDGRPLCLNPRHQVVLLNRSGKPIRRSTTNIPHAYTMLPRHHEVVSRQKYAFSKSAVHGNRPLANVKVMTDKEAEEHAAKLKKATAKLNANMKAAGTASASKKEGKKPKQTKKAASKANGKANGKAKSTTKPKADTKKRKRSKKRVTIADVDTKVFSDDEVDPVEEMDAALRYAQAEAAEPSVPMGSHASDSDTDDEYIPLAVHLKKKKRKKKKKRSTSKADQRRVRFRPPPAPAPAPAPARVQQVQTEEEEEYTDEDSDEDEEAYENYVPTNRQPKRQRTMT